MQPDLFAWQPPSEPSPTPERFRRAKGEPRDYRAEVDRFFADRPDVMLWIADKAEELRATGCRRIEVNQIVADARRRFTVSINNSWRAAIADVLCERDERLSKLIERRRRKTTTAGEGRP